MVTDGVVKVNGAEIHYDEQGAGQPVVLVHAGVCDRRMWDPHMAVLAAQYRVVRYDARGYGQTASANRIFSLWPKRFPTEES